MMAPCFFFTALYITVFLSKHRNDTFVYSLERFRKKYKVKTNNNRSVNWPILAIDVLNLAWAIAGVVLDNTLAVPESNKGAIVNCSRDFGMNTCLIALVFMTLGWAQILRLMLYLLVIVNHQSFLGKLEARFRNPVFQR